MAQEGTYLVNAMSTEAEEEVAAAGMCCASCGQAEIDDMKLKNCDGGCDLVKYCSDNGCQEKHREQHEEECKSRAAELRDRDLFTQPDISCYGECPICCLPLSIDPSKSSLMSCCSKMICNGCSYANKKREYEAGLEQRCAFCREPLAISQEEHNKKRMERIKKNCTVAMVQMGKMRRNEGDYKYAFRYFTNAAALGDASAHFELAVMYENGQGVKKDTKKEIYHLEEAAIASDPSARHNLGVREWENGRFEIAKKHFIIAANLGLHDSLDNLKHIYAIGHASKEEYANALRAYQAAVEATKSPEREEAEVIRNGAAKFI